MFWHRVFRSGVRQSFHSLVPDPIPSSRVQGKTSSVVAFVVIVFNLRSSGTWLHAGLRKELLFGLHMCSAKSRLRRISFVKLVC
jgi:hypothetical protein